MIKKTKLLIAISCVLLLINAGISSISYAATSTITVTSTPYLSFIDVPDSIEIGDLITPTSDTALFSDSNGINLPSSRHLTIRDTRGCGGLNLQLQADSFTPSSTQIIPNNLRVVTTTADQESGTVVSNVEYLSGYTGDQTITAPLEAGSTDFGTSTTFTSKTNSLETARDLLQGNLTAPTGRDGQIHISTSFYLLVPKLTIPNDYYTTLTYTLSDDTTGTCS